MHDQSLSIIVDKNGYNIWYGSNHHHTWVYSFTFLFVALDPTVGTFASRDRTFLFDRFGQAFGSDAKIAFLSDWIFLELYGLFSLCTLQDLPQFHLLVRCSLDQSSCATTIYHTLVSIRHFYHLYVKTNLWIPRVANRKSVNG